MPAREAAIRRPHPRPRPRPRIVARISTLALTLTLALILPLLLAACADDNDASPTATPGATPAATLPPVAAVTPPADVEPLPTQQPVDAWHDALLIGTLVLDNGCLYLEGTPDDPASRWSVIWQFGWALQERDSVVTLIDPSGAPRAQVGDTLGIGGSGGARSATPDPNHPCLQQSDLWFASPDVSVHVLDVTTP